ncbi:MAG: hypothetical protein KDJ35_02535 [Alphaproteobacteria bacterium]|nr:hypothetical protein [Alphaproteobacteria bacterium]
MEVRKGQESDLCFEGCTPEAREALSLLNSWVATVNGQVDANLYAEYESFPERNMVHCTFRTKKQDLAVAFISASDKGFFWKSDGGKMPLQYETIDGFLEHAEPRLFKYTI